MKAGLTALALALLALGGAPASADSLTAGLPGMMGGVGITPNGTGFSGEQGDPVYYAETLAPPATAPPAAYRQAPGGAWYGYSAPGQGGLYAPAGPPPMQYYYMPYPPAR